ncbi:MAG: hypothetical protein U0610_26985 [bacterium]
MIRRFGWLRVSRALLGFAAAPRCYSKCAAILTLSVACGSGSNGTAPLGPSILAAYYGYDDCLGVADANGDGTNADEAAAAGCRVVAAADGTAVTSAPTPLQLALVCAGQAGPEQLVQLDGMPVVFSHQLVQDTLDADDFEIQLSDGTSRTPVCATTAPANEENEDRTVLLIGDFGSRQPVSGETAGGPSPVELRVVGSVELEGTDATTGAPLDARGLSYAGQYLDYRLGPGVLLAEIAPFSTDGEGAVGRGLPNDCRTIFPDTTHVVRVTWSGGVSVDGVRAIPSDRTATYDVRVENDRGERVSIGDASLGDSIRLLGLADLGDSFASSPDAAVVDGDNVVDLCLALADGFDPARVRTVATACNTTATALYDPAGDAPCLPLAIAVSGA